MPSARTKEHTAHGNNYDLLRLIAAATVFIAHSFDLAGAGDPLYAFTGLPLAVVGVGIFFTISGYLISESWRRDPNVWRYAMRRALRLLPALVVVVLITAFLLGTALTTLRISHYLTSLTPYWYVLHNSLLLTFNRPLPGLFATNPKAGIVNGSLWTLPVETIGYASIAIAGTLGLLRRNLIGLVVVALLVIVWVSPVARTTLGNSPVIGTPAFIMLYLSLFAIGAFAKLLPRASGFSPMVLVLLTGLWIASWKSAAIYLASAPLIAYVALHAGRATKTGVTRVLTRPGDVSYGLYIYAFPIQQAAIVLLGARTTPWRVLAYTGPVIYICALLSWRLIEAPALRHKPGVAISK